MKYSYKCHSCQKTKEVKHAMSESPTVTCKCGMIMRRYPVKGYSIHAGKNVPNK